MERMADWKSAVDPTTGKTYWYHRKTRESRWTKPQFIEEMEGSEPVSEPIKVSKASTTPKSSSNPQRDSLPVAKGLAMERDIYRFYSGEVKDEQLGLGKLFNLIGEKSFERSLFLDTSIISDLATYAITVTNNELRWQALRCLWRIAMYRHISSRAIQQNTSWKGLAVYITKWTHPAAKLLTLAIFSCVIIGDTTDSIPDEDYAILCGEAKSMYLCSDKFSSSEQELINRSLDDLSKQALFFSSEQGKKGHILPSYLLLLLSKYHLYSPSPLERVLASNIAACLQRVYVAHQVFEESEIAVFAKELLLQCMVKSVHVLEGMLDGFLAISTDISQTAKALGPSPSTYAYLKNVASEAELEEAVHGGVFEVKTYHDLPDEAAERFLRDVEWIPKSGVGWQLNSVLLWLRCPALRDLVNDFWQQGGGSHTAETAGSVLELSIDASDEVVETICHYVHYGGLILPPTLVLQLETLKVASELGLLALQDQMEMFLCQDINGDNLDMLYQAAQENHYRRIEDGCVRFMNGELQDHRREETLQRTLASSIQGLNLTGTGGVLRTKDLHDFEDVPDDVLHGTFNQTVAGASRGGKHVSETFGGHLTASNPSVDYRTMNEEADNYMQSLKMSKKMQEYEEDFQASEALYRPSSGHSATTSATAGKTKSGGIYSLLLGENEDGFAGADMYTTNQFGQEVIKEAKRPPSGQSKAGLANTTSGARRSSSGGKNVPNLQEFDPSTMSLVPKKEKNEHEKRLEELSKPRSQQTPNSHRKNSHDLDIDTSMTSDPSETSHHPSSTRSTASGKESLAKTTSSAGAKRPGSASATKAKPTTPSATTQMNKRGSAQVADDEPLPEDIYLHQGDTPEDDHMYQQNQNPRSAVKSAPLSQQRSNNNSMNNTAKSPAPLLSSTSNPRLRPSNTEPTFHDRENDRNNDTNNVEGGTQIRSSLALLKAKVSKTAGRSRRISAGAAIGNFAQPAGDGLDSESTSPLPSSSTAGHLSAPNSLGNTLENQPSSMRHSQQLPPNRYNNQRNASSQPRTNAYGEADDEEYADDFDHFSSNDYSNSQPGKSNTLQRTQSNRSNNNNNSNNKFQEENDFDDVPPRSSAAAYLEKLEQIAEHDGTVYAGADTSAEDMGAEFAQENMEECPDCGRFFAPEPFSRHMKICKKVFLSKRKVFDSSKQRLDANPETLNKKKTGGRGANNKASAAPAAANSSASKWKEQSKQFREAMRAVRNGATNNNNGGGDNGGKNTDSGSTQPYIDPTLIQCPNCQRRFNDKAAERHIPICKNIIAKPSSLKKGGGQTAGSLTATQTRTAGGASSGFGGNGNGNGSSGTGFNGARTTGVRSGGGWN